MPRCRHGLRCAKSKPASPIATTSNVSSILLMRMKGEFSAAEGEPINFRLENDSSHRTPALSLGEREQRALHLFGDDEWFAILGGQELVRVGIFQKPLGFGI